MAKFDQIKKRNYIVDVRNNCKISQYKIKKILENFTADYTATDASKKLKLNIKTINRYYNIFRKIILQVSVEELKFEAKNVKYIGWVKGIYGGKCYFKIYKIDKKTFYCTKTLTKPNTADYAIKDKDFDNYLNFIHKRLSKIRCVKGKNYYYQLFESLFKYKYSQENNFNFIWNKFKKLESID